MKKLFVFIILCVIMIPIVAGRKRSRLTSGDPAPEFTLQGDDGKWYSLADYIDGKVALFFYPRDSSYYCTQQVCNLSDGYTLLKKKGIQLFGINHQSIESHRAFKEKHAVPFTLLSDPKSKVIKEYGAYSPFFTRRITVLIENGRIVKVLRNIDVNKHAEQILTAFDLIS